MITAIVGAIRIGGPNWLKAIIGRARENRTAAEMELTTSTSHNVCELWNGKAVVRLTGFAKVIALLYFPDGLTRRMSYAPYNPHVYQLEKTTVETVFSLQEAVDWGFLEEVPDKPFITQVTKNSRFITNTFAELLKMFESFPHYIFFGKSKKTKTQDE